MNPLPTYMEFHINGEFIQRALIQNCDAERPDRIKSDYERVMREAGLLPSDPVVQPVAVTIARMPAVWRPASWARNL
jgi:hypothetical protein